MNLIALVAFLLSLIPFLVYIRNRSLFRRAPVCPTAVAAMHREVSVLLPARNEERNIAACLEALLASRDVRLEVVVLDDQSEDGTAQIVRGIAERDGRVRLEQGARLPAGWCGKQHACSQLARLARHDTLVFIDTDVRLSPDALCRSLELLRQSRIDLLSGFPGQVMVTWSEQLLIPLIHFLLLGFLSLRRMRASRHSAYGAGCGQLFVTHRRAYEQSGGHAAIRSSLHDGLKLPRRYREMGLTSDLFDASDIADCRMYRSVGEVFSGLRKNATEGIADPRLIVPATLLLAGGQIVPPLLLFAALFGWGGSVVALSLAGIATLLSYLVRFDAAYRFRQPLLGACLHPLAVTMFLLLQWQAFFGARLGHRVSWKGRPYIIRA